METKDGHTVMFGEMQGKANDLETVRSTMHTGKIPNFDAVLVQFFDQRKVRVYFEFAVLTKPWGSDY